jgi:hypothetical protein
LTNQREEIARTDLDWFVIAEDKNAQMELLSQCLQFLEVRFKATFIVHGAVVTVASPWLAHKMQFVVTSFKRPARGRGAVQLWLQLRPVWHDRVNGNLGDARGFALHTVHAERMTRHTFRFPRFQKWLKRRFLPVTLQETIYIMHGNKFFVFAAVTGDGDGESIGPKGLVRAKELVHPWSTVKEIPSMLGGQNACVP